MAFHRGTADDYQDLVAKVRDLATNRYLASAVVVAGGTGYAVGDLLTVLGGTSTIKAVVEVTAEAAGVVTAVRVYNAGTYTADPGSPASTRCFRDNGGDDGLTLTLTMAAPGWTLHRDATYTVGAITTERELIMEGIGAGADQIFVGMRSYNARNEDIRGIECAGFTGYVGANTWPNQPGISPGRFDLGQDGSFLIAANGKMPYWISVTDRRIIGVVRAYNYYASFYLGYINAFATPAEYPYPLFVGGNSNKHDLGSVDFPWKVSTRRLGSIVNPVSEGSTIDIGPVFLRDPGGVWKGFANWEVAGASQLLDPLEDSVVYPFGFHDATGFSRFISVENQIVVTQGGPLLQSWEDMLDANEDNLSNVLMLPTPDGGTGTFPLIAATLMRKSSLADQVIYGELDSCFMTPGKSEGDFLQPEDRYIDGTDRYIVFAHGVEGAPHYLWGLKEF